MYRRIALFAFVSLCSGLASGSPVDLDEGNSFFVLDDFEEALRVYSEVASASGEDAPLALFLVGKCHARLGRPEEAVVAYQRLVEHYPDTQWAALAGNALGDAYAALGEWEKALVAYQGVAQRFHGSTEAVQARLNMAGVQNNPFNDGDNDYNEAIRNYLFVLDNRDQIEKVGINMGQVYFGMGEAFRNLNRYDRAIAYFEKSRAEDPEGIWGAAGQNMIGYCRLAMRQNEAAVQAFRNTSDQFRQQPAFVKAANTRLSVLERQGIVVQAERAPVRIDRGRWLRALKGSVQITAEDWRLECNQAEWDPQTRNLTCSGDVHFHRNGVPLFTADELRFRVPAEQTIVLPPPPAPEGIRQQIEVMQQGSFPAMQTD